MSRRSLPPVSFTFAEGRYFDLWMLVHFGSGIAGGFSNVVFGLTRPQVLALGLLLMLIWEAGEMAMGVRERVSNRIVDVAVGMFGVVLALGVAPRLPEAAQLAAFVLTLVASLTGMGLGVRSYRRRKAAGLD